ncbi:MAG: NAD-dependent epimerase/dehydratase family protein [Gemmatimonadota bacterium]
MSRVVVTGATGFLGQPLCATLAERGHHVRALVRHTMEPHHPLVEAFPFDGLHDHAALRAACLNATAVVHLAARVHVMRDELDAESRFTAVNVDGTLAVLEAARAGGVRHVLLASSVKAVGEANDASWTEAVIPSPVDAYGRSKLAAERLALAFGGENGITVTVLRLPLVYGPGASANVLRLLALVRSGWPLPLGAVDNRRSMLYRDNAVAAMIAVLDAGSDARGVFFVSDAVDLSTPSLIRTIARAIGRPARLLSVPVALLRAAGRLGDVLPLPLSSAEVARLTGSLTVATDRLRKVTGFEPPVSVDEGWRRTAHWYLTGKDA